MGEEKGAWLRGRQQDCSPALCDASGPSRSCERRRAADGADLRTAAVHPGSVSHSSANNIGESWVVIGYSGSGLTGLSVARQTPTQRILSPPCSLSVTPSSSPAAIMGTFSLPTFGQLPLLSSRLHPILRTTMPSGGRTHRCILLAAG